LPNANLTAADLAGVSGDGTTEIQWTFRLTASISTLTDTLAALGAVISSSTPSCSLTAQFKLGQ
jgi:hypothetical protein